MTRAWLAVALLLAGIGAGCSQKEAPDAVGAAPPLATLQPLTADAGERLLLAADDARRVAYRSGDPSGLAELFGGSSLTADQGRLAEQKRRGVLREETADLRRLVHWRAGPGDPEGVLEVRARQRMTSTGRPESGWSTLLRQWWARLRWVDGAWRVVEDHDLPPDRWWRT